MSSVFAVIGIGFFAQWSILSNITSGVIMFFTFPYKIGDYIKIHDKEFPYEGMIEDIKSFHVMVRTKDNELITYPNSMMLQKGVTVVKAEAYHESIQEEEAHDKNLTEHGTDWWVGRLLTIGFLYPLTNNTRYSYFASQLYGMVTNPYPFE